MIPIVTVYFDAFSLVLIELKVVISLSLCVCDTNTPGLKLNSDGRPSLFTLEVSS